MLGKSGSSEQQHKPPGRERIRLFTAFGDEAARIALGAGERGEYNARSAYAAYPPEQPRYGQPQPSYVSSSARALGVMAHQEALSVLNTVSASLGREATGGMVPNSMNLEQADADIAEGFENLLQQEADQEQLAVQAAENITMEAARQPQVAQLQPESPDDGAAQLAQAARAKLAQIHGTSTESLARPEIAEEPQA